MSEFAERIGFPSEAGLDVIERNRQECPLSVIEKVESATGISADWIKHGRGVPYAARRDLVLLDAAADMETIACLDPERIFVCLDRWFFNVALVVRSRQHCWTIFEDLCQIDVHRWIGDEQEIAGVYDFLHQLFERFDRIEDGRRVESREMPWTSYRRLVSGSVCPKVVLAKHPVRTQDGQTNHWADDIRDIYHRFPIARSYQARYGAWFLKAQECFRCYIPEDAAVRPFSPEL